MSPRERIGLQRPHRAQSARRGQCPVVNAAAPATAIASLPVMTLMMMVSGCGALNRLGVSRPETADEAFAECMRSHGVDAEALGELGVLFDPEGKLSAREGEALAMRCDNKVQQAGCEDPPADDSEEFTYRGLVEEWECYREAGVILPPLASEERSTLPCPRGDPARS